MKKDNEFELNDYQKQLVFKDKLIIGLSCFFIGVISTIIIMGVVL